MRHGITFVLAAVLFLLLLAAPGFCAGHKVFYVEEAKHAAGRVSMGEMIASLGYDARNVTAAAAAGRFVPKAPAVLIFSSFCTRDGGIRRFLVDKAAALEVFVERGGCVIMFAQDAADRLGEDWLPPGMILLRGGPSSDHLDYVYRYHPIFSFPCAVSGRRLNRSWKGSPLSHGSFRLVARGWILAAREEKGRGPWCVEFGFGLGRAVFFACEPERRKTDPSEAIRAAANLVENALAYAVQVARGRAVPLPDSAVVIRKKAGFLPRTWDDSKRARFAFEAEVNAAVDRGIAFLERRQSSDGSWKLRPGHDTGCTALALTALLGTGVNKYRASIKRGVAFLLSRRAGLETEEANTYDVGLTMMALDAWAAPMYERFEIEKLPSSKRESFRFQRNLSGTERALMAGCRDWLVNAQLENGYWTYRAGSSGRGGDLSNTQFALLGLHAAARCGESIPRRTWEKNLEALIDSQARTGPVADLLTIRNPGVPGARPKFYVFRAKARPWGYTPGAAFAGLLNARGRGGSASGSRTAMGISSLLIAREGLARNSRSAASRYDAAVHKAVRDGLAWLDANWSVKENPGLGRSHLLYYLYALERVGVLAEKKFIGDHDWYREGAAFLLAAQEGSGGWSRSVVDTSFALMFLKRSTPPPVITAGGK